MLKNRRLPRHRRLRHATVAAIIASLFSLLCAVEATADTPTVQITAPTQESTVKGTVTVTASASASSGQSLEIIKFYDGVNEIGEADCDKQTSCEVSVHWKATGLSGSHTLTAKAYETSDSSATSTPVAVTVVSPPPTISITSPVAGSSVKGTVLVSATGLTDPSQDDYPTSIVVYDGVNEIASINCQGQQTCAGSVSWHATGLSGLHSLRATLNTHNGLRVESAPNNVTVLSPAPTVAITSPTSAARLGGTILVKVSGATDPSQVDYPTSIAVYDGSNEVGIVDCQGQQTCGGSVSWNTEGLRGAQTLTAVIRTETGRTATSGRVVVGGPKPHLKPRKAPAKSPAKGTCKLASLLVAAGHADRGMCTLPGVPSGTRVVVQYRSKSGGWTTAVSDHVGHNGHFRFRLRGKKRAVYELTVLVYANRVYAATRFPLGKLRID